jgi:tetratricopeptide (TPR) repeat protein
MQMRSLIFAGVVSTLFVACGTTRDAAWEVDEAATTPKAEAHTGQRESLLTEANEAWEQRDEASQVKKAIDAWREATEINPKDADALVSLARAEYFLADCHINFEADSKERYKKILESATRSAERALMALSDEFTEKMRSGWRIEEAVTVLDERAVPALYWRSSALGKWATADGFATLLSYKDEVKAIMQRCLDLDQAFYFYGPDRYFGVFYGRAPAMSGGDLGKSKHHFEISLSKYPNYFATRVLMADDYAVKAQNKELYRELLQYVIDGDPESLPEAAPENRCEQRKAKILLEDIEERFE